VIIKAGVKKHLMLSLSKHEVLARKPSHPGTSSFDRLRMRGFLAIEKNPHPELVEG
jgi:hypothetical protein